MGLLFPHLPSHEHDTLRLYSFRILLNSHHGCIRFLGSCETSEPSICRWRDKEWQRMHIGCVSPLFKCIFLCRIRRVQRFKAVTKEHRTKHKVFLSKRPCATALVGCLWSLLVHTSSRLSPRNFSIKRG